MVRSFKIKYLFIILLLLSQVRQLRAATYSFNANCLAAQEHVFALRFREAQALLASEKQSNPDNLVPVLLENYIDFFKNIINEEQSLYKQTKANETARLKTLKLNAVVSPWQRYTQAEIMLQWAFVKLKLGDNFSAGTNIRDAYKILQQNAAEYPDFKLNGKSLGLIEALIGTVPEQYSWIVKLVGLKGNINAGAAKIKACLDAPAVKPEDKYFKLETAFVYAMVQHHLQKQSEQAWTTIEPYTRDYKNSMLQNYMRALVAGYSGRNDEAIAVLSVKPSYFAAYPFYFMDYMLGVAMMRKLDAAGADIHFKVYTVKHPGSTYIKSAYRYLAWSSLMQGNTEYYKTYCSLCSKKGKSNSEEDKQALKEALADEPPDLNLLRGRLLFDGRYYDKALASLSQVSENSLPAREKLELSYRFARVYHEQKNYTKARTYYLQTIEKGKAEPFYFAAYSALQLGFICEAEKQNDKAAAYFKMAKDDFSANKEYRASIEQKAKAGLKRLGR